jgi:tetratricopeptide (TPR) repeat protein
VTNPLSQGLKGPAWVALCLALLICVLSTNSLAQRGGGTTSTPIAFGDGHLIIGDLKVSGMAPAETVFYVVLYAGVNVVQRQPVSNNGRFRFMGIPNGDYALAVEYEGREIYRNPFRLAERQKTDVRKDIAMEMRVGPGRSSSVPAVTSIYQRSPANQSLFDSAKAAIEKRQIDQAQSLLNQIVAKDPKDFVAWSELGTLSFKQQKYSDAEKAYQKALEAKPDFLVTLINLGKLRVEQKNYDGAIEVLSKAVELEPKSAEAQHYLGEAYLLNKKGSKAVVHLNEAVRLDPAGKAEIHLRLAALYNGAGMKDKAAAEYAQFLVKQPNYPEKAKLQDYIKQNKKP